MTAGGTPLPTAGIKPRRGFSWAWIVPIASLVLAGWLGVRAWAERGLAVTVHLEEGYGLRAGDEVRYRGIAVGEVRAVELDPHGDGIELTVSLRSQADRLARAGSRFWVVRPQLGLARIEGVETLIGPRYLAVLPGRGPRQRHFLGLDEPPVVETREPGDLEIILTARQQGSLRRGAPVTYRQIRIGSILSVGLTSDGSSVEARVHIDQPFAQLIRQGTRFWDVGGVEASVGLAGVTVRVETLQTVLTGGVALATPPEAGEVVRTGHRFRLEPQAPEDWLAWEPMAVVGSSMLPPGAPVPAPLRATVNWRQGRLIARQKSRQGWVLQTEHGLIGPADLFVPADPDDRENTVLEAAGEVLPLEIEPAWNDGALALLAVHLPVSAWSAQRQRHGAEPEDCLAIGDYTAAPLPLAAARLELNGHAWAVDPAIAVDESWHGAAVVARADGALLGLLLVEDDVARVALLPAD